MMPGTVTISKAKITHIATHIRLRGQQVFFFCQKHEVQSVPAIVTSATVTSINPSSVLVIFVTVSLADIMF